MKIARIRLYQVDYPLVEGRYTWADGKFVEVFDSTIIEIEPTRVTSASARYARSVPSIFRRLRPVPVLASVSWRRI